MTNPNLRHPWQRKPHETPALDRCGLLIVPWTAAWPFLVFGVLAGMVRSNLEVSSAVAKFFSLFLLIKSPAIITTVLLASIVPASRCTTRLPA